MCWVSGELIPCHGDKPQTLSEFSEAANRRENNTYYTSSNPFKSKSSIGKYFEAAKASGIATFFFSLYSYISSWCDTVILATNCSKLTPPLTLLKHKIYILIYIQQYATLHSLFISGNCSTYFGWRYHPKHVEQFF